MVTWSLQHKRDTAANWTAANPTLLAGQFGYETDTNKLKVGDGSTAWTSLAYFGGGGSWGSMTGTLSDQTDLQEELDNKQDRTSELLTGGVVTVETIDGTGTLNDIRVTASTFFIAGSGNHSAIQTDFLNIVNCASGNTKYIDIFGLTDGTVTKVEGTEGVGATHPTPPANSVRLGYVHWGDAGSLGTGTSTTAHLTPLVFGWTTFNPADSQYYYVPVTSNSTAFTTNTVPGAVASKSGNIVCATIFTRGAGGPTLEAMTFEYQINNSATWETITTNYTLSGSAYAVGVTYMIIDLSSVPVVKGDAIMLRFLTPAWVTNPTGFFGTVVLYIE